MTLTREMLLEILKTSSFATMVTVGKKRLTSRTMHYGYSPPHGIFLLTHRGSGKLAEIEKDKHGLLHISQICDDITASIDISISGNYEVCDESSPFYREGFVALGKHMPSILDILDSDAKSDYELLLFHITEIRGWSYLQALNGEPKTIIKG